MHTQNTQIYSKGNLLLPNCLPKAHTRVYSPISVWECLLSHPLAKIKHYHFSDSLSILEVKMESYVLIYTSNQYWEYPITLVICLSPFVTDYLFITYALDTPEHSALYSAGWEVRDNFGEKKSIVKKNQKMHVSRKVMHNPTSQRESLLVI